MRHLFFGLIVMAMSASAQAALPLEQLFYKGQAIPYYGSPQTQSHQQIEDVLKRSQLAERMARLVNGTTHLKRDLAVGFESCGQVNAFYNPQRSAVIVCLDLLETMVKAARSDPDMAQADKASFARTIDGAIWGVFFHELGHAIIDIDRVPITGREEDVADQFALYFAVHFIEPQGVEVVQPTVWFFTQTAKNSSITSADQDTLKKLMSNEHSLDEQRRYNLACWAYGANPSKGVVSAKYVELPRDRASRCPAEFVTMDNGVRRQFQKFLKVRAQ